MYTSPVSPADLKRRVSQLNNWLASEGLPQRLSYTPVGGSHTVGWYSTHGEVVFPLWTGRAKECKAVAEIAYRQWYIAAEI